MSSPPRAACPQPPHHRQPQQQIATTAVHPAVAAAAHLDGDQAVTQESEPLIDAQQQEATSLKPRKSVRWSTITVHEFGVGLGGSAVSNKGGPSIGLADTPEFTWTTRVGEMAECVEGVHRFSPHQRIRLLQAAGIPDGIITRHARETNIILGSRRRSKISYDEDEEEDDNEDEEGMEVEQELEVECKELPRKRSADQAMLERPCSVYLRRPRMIPVNYV